MAYLEVEDYNYFYYCKLLKFKREIDCLAEHPSAFRQTLELLRNLGIEKKVLSTEMKKETGEIITHSRRIFQPDIVEILEALKNYLDKYASDFEADESHLFGKVCRESDYRTSSPPTRSVSFGQQIHFYFP